MTDDLHNDFGMICPKCGQSSHIDVAAVVWVRLCPDGTDVYEAANGDHEWSEASAAYCAHCGQHGTVALFSQSGRYA